MSDPGEANRKKLKATSEEHRHIEKSTPNTGEIKQLLQAFKKGLDGLERADLLPRTPCPDSWTLASYVTGQLDQKTQRDINAHIAFCDQCFDDFVALTGPEEIANILGKPRQPKELPAGADAYKDLTLKCIDCGAKFVFTAGEQMFFAEKGFGNKPRRCRACKAKRSRALRRTKVDERTKKKTAEDDRPRNHLHK